MAKDSLMKKIFEEENKFDSRRGFFWKIMSSQPGVFWSRRELQVNHETVRKSAIFPQPGNQNRLMSRLNNRALLSRQNFVPFK